jgi:hypothetical protein
MRALSCKLLALSLKLTAYSLKLRDNNLGRQEIVIDVERDALGRLSAARRRPGMGL